MIKRSLSAEVLVCALLLGALMVGAPAHAQDQSHDTYVSFWAVPRAQWDNFEKSEEQKRPVFERLVKDGTLVA